MKNYQIFRQSKNFIWVDRNGVELKPRMEYTSADGVSGMVAYTGYAQALIITDDGKMVYLHTLEHKTDKNRRVLMGTVAA